MCAGVHDLCPSLCSHGLLIYTIHTGLKNSSPSLYIRCNVYAWCWYQLAVTTAVTVNCKFLRESGDRCWYHRLFLTHTAKQCMFKQLSTPGLKRRRYDLYARRKISCHIRKILTRHRPLSLFSQYETLTCSSMEHSAYTHIHTKKHWECISVVWSCASRIYEDDFLLKLWTLFFGYQTFALICL